MLDGVEIKTLNLKWLRKQMGLVRPDPCPSYPSSPNPNPYPYLTSDPIPLPLSRWGRSRCSSKVAWPRTSR